MSERLTTRLANGGVGYDNGEYFKVCYPWKENCLSDIDRMAIRLCELEDKIEKGDVVEVVRCKDCKWCEDLLMSGLYCNHPDNRNPITCFPTDFCNCGERK